MQTEPPLNSEKRSDPDLLPLVSPPHNHGSALRDPSLAGHDGQPREPSNRPSVQQAGAVDVDPDNTDELARKLRGLSQEESSPAVERPGQRILEYEQALARPSQAPSRPLGFKVTRGPNFASEGVQLLDLPLEILAQVVSYLPHDAQNAVSLVNKQLRDVVTTPHVWFLAFARQFPGTKTPSFRDVPSTDIWDQGMDSQIIYQRRFFPRLTHSASWRSEYVFRTRLLKDLAHGRPSNGMSELPAQQDAANKKTAAIITYWPEVDQPLTNLQAAYPVNKPARAIHGTAGSGRVTVSDPTTGRVEKWARRDLITPANAERNPLATFYGLSPGPTDAVHAPNCMDVSVVYGRVGGECLPGGGVFYIGANQQSHYLAHEIVRDPAPGNPHILDHDHGISSVWIAKSSEVPIITQSTVGIMSGSTCGVVRAYSLAPENSKSRAFDGVLTAQWVLSPGVPIISIKVDERYNAKRKNTSRVWAVALNALGEVFYLTEPPVNPLTDSKNNNVKQSHEHAWDAGRSVHWHLLDQTRRQPKADADELDIAGIRTSSHRMGLSKDHLVEEARKVSELCTKKPYYFRKRFDGWNMQRSMQVDFAADDGEDCGESIFVHGHTGNNESRIHRFTRVPSEKPAPTAPQHAATSIFGPTPVEASALPDSEDALSKEKPQAWRTQLMDSLHHTHGTLTALALDNSEPSLRTLREDALCPELSQKVLDAPTDAPRSLDDRLDAIPGRRARLLVGGTSTGAVLVWNARGEAKKLESIAPARVIQTTSPSITAVAATALYVIHGGSDGTAQMWDPLASTLGPVKTINTKHHHKIPRRLMTLVAGLPQHDLHAVQAISVDSDPLMLRGCLTTGLFVRSWSFGAVRKPAKKRRARVTAKNPSRRTATAFTGFIAKEAAAAHKERHEREAELKRMRARFGLGELSEAEAVQYAQMLSQEHEQQMASGLTEHERAQLERLVAQDVQSVSHSEDGHSSSSSAGQGTVITGSSVTADGATSTTPERSYDDGLEVDMQRALRLSLMESTEFNAQSPHAAVDNEYPIMYKAKPSKKSKRTGSSSDSSAKGESSKRITEDEELAIALSLSIKDAQAPASGANTPGPAQRSAQPSRTVESNTVDTADDDLALALKLSLQEQQGQPQGPNFSGSADEGAFPPLGSTNASPQGKGKGVARR